MPIAIEVIVNSKSGSYSTKATQDELEELFAANGIEANFYYAGNGRDFKRSIKAAAESNAGIMVAGGGDGTISAIASAAAKAGKTLGVLPLGTLNHFSKDLKIPQEIADAVRILAEGQTTTIDLAEVNGKRFINNSSIGLYPRIVKKREQQQRLGHGKWRAALWAALRVFHVARFLKVRIEIDNKTFLRKTPFVFVGNNQYEMDLYNIGSRPSLDCGKLSVYFLRRGGRWGVILLLMRTLTGTVRQWRDFEEVLTDAVTIQTRRRRLEVAFDGEVATLETPLNYKSLPRALKVIVPAGE